MMVACYDELAAFDMRNLELRVGPQLPIPMMSLGRTTWLSQVQHGTTGHHHHT